MRILVFDTETTGLPQTKIMSPDTLHLWPHILQFSYIIYDTKINSIVESVDSIIKLNNIKISDESTKIHGITNEISNEKGEELELILNEFFYYLKNVDLLVGHNISFDINMVRVELLRLIYSDKNEKMIEHKYNLHFITNYKKICCTLKNSIELCNLEAKDKKGNKYLKYPKLLELHQKLFDSIPNNLHNSFNDILITLRCYMKLIHDVDLNSSCYEFSELTKNLNLLSV